jgi:hypothetical protein
MKQGKVFEKLAARKNVQGITFQDKTCTVTLTNGMKKVCNTAHEARLFVEGKEIAGATQTIVPAPGNPLYVEPTPTVDTSAVEVKDGVHTIELDASFVRRAAGDLVSIPAGTRRVRVSLEAAAALIAGGEHRF